MRRGKNPPRRNYYVQRGCRRSSTILVQQIQYSCKDLKNKCTALWCNGCWSASTIYDTMPGHEWKSIISTCRAARPDPRNSIYTVWEKKETKEKKENKKKKEKKQKKEKEKKRKKKKRKERRLRYDLTLSGMYGFDEKITSCDAPDHRHTFQSAPIVKCTENGPLAHNSVIDDDMFGKKSDIMRMFWSRRRSRVRWSALTGSKKTCYFKGSLHLSWVEYQIWSTAITNHKTNPK